MPAPTFAGLCQFFLSARRFHTPKRVSRPALQSNLGEYSGRTHIAHPIQPDIGKRGDELACTDSGASTGLSGGTGTGSMEMSETILCLQQRGGIAGPGGVSGSNERAHRNILLVRTGIECRKVQGYDIPAGNTPVWDVGEGSGTALHGQ